MGESKKDSPKDLEQKVKEHQAVLLKYPKNIRQIGEVGDGQRIYVEDYVMTYAMHLSTKAKEAYSSAVLLGQKAIVEGRRTLFISGAVEISQQWQQNLSITGEQWTFVYDQIQKYFHDIEIVGWFLTHPGMDLEPDEQVRSVWRSSFEGTDKILFLYDNISREDAFYTCKDGEFSQQSGYYIYYEKNEEMQNYMIDQKGGKSSDEGYQDTASKRIRQKIQEKNEEHKKYLFHQQIVYSVGIFASAVVLVTAATKLYYSTEDEGMADFVQDSQMVSQNDSWILSEKETDSETKKEEKNGKNQNAGTDEKEQSTEDGNSSQEEEVKDSNQKEQDEMTQTGEKENETEIEEQENQEEDTTTEGSENRKDTTENEQNTAKGSDSDESDTVNSLDSTVGTKTGDGKEKKRYKVKKGDTLESISISCYGTSSYVKKIKKINKLENADKIYIGQELILP